MGEGIDPTTSPCREIWSQLQTQEGYGVLVGSPTNRALTLRYATKDFWGAKTNRKTRRRLDALGWNFLGEFSAPTKLAETRETFETKILRWISLEV